MRHVSACIGVALAVYLLLLKISARPCPTGGCEAVIFSSYGQILGIPVSAFGLLGWLGLCFSSQRIRTVSILLLALGTVWFLCVQAFLLHRYCGLCLGHAAMVLLTLAGMNRVRFPTIAGGAVMGAALMLVSLPLAPPVIPTTSPVVSTPQAPAAKAAANPTFTLRFNAALRTVENATEAPLARAAASSGKAWLGPITDQSAMVAISLTCSHCMDTLWELTAKYAKHLPVRGPKLLFLTGPGNEPVHRHVIAAVLARSAAHGEARGFIAVLELLSTHRDELLTGNTVKIASVLLGADPNYG
ncbi:MAG: vitamin K epoxide reductase family protein, partial [bacterium]